MPALSPKVGTQLVKATRARDLDEAFEKVFSEYLNLKIDALQDTISRFEDKWGMGFSTFKRRLRSEDLPEDTYAYATEQDLWEWEEAESLKTHYDQIRQEWM